jgi:hypothetical protein
VVAVGFEFVREKNADPAKFCVLVTLEGEVVAL